MIKLLKTIGGGILFIGLFVGIGVVSAAVVWDDETVETSSDTSQTIVTKRDEEVALKDAKPISVLLAGLDTGAMMYEDEEVSRTDALIVATLNPKTKQTTLTSIPRDTWMPINTDGTFDKINHAYVYGGIQQTHAAVQDYLGIPIDYYMTVDMKAFIEGVDEMGGLMLTPNQTFEQDGSHFIEEERKVYTGEEVMNYARMRKKDPDGDVGRQARQRQVIDEVMKQYVTVKSVKELPGLYELFNEHVETNLEMTDLFELFKQYQPALENMRTIAFTQHEDVRENGIYYLYIDDMHRNTIHKGLADNLEVPHDFQPIVYPLSVIPEQPHFDTQDLNVDGVISNPDSPVPAGLYTQEELDQALKPQTNLGY